MREDVANIGEHLCGADAIARKFRVKRGQVQKWHKAGAPIVYLGKKYQANYAELWEWLKQRDIEKSGQKE